MEKITTNLKVPLSKDLQRHAGRIAQFLEWTNQTSTPLFIALAAVVLFRRELMMNDRDQTVVASNGMLCHDVPCRAIWQEVNKRAVEYWTLEDVPPDFVRACQDIVKRTGIPTPGQAVAMSIGYMAKLVEYVEMSLTLFVGQQIEDGYSLDYFESSILGATHVRTLH